MFIKILTLLFISAVKFIFAFPIAYYEYHFKIYETILITSAGGISGILFFAYLSDILIRLWFRFSRRFIHHHITVKVLPKFLMNKRHEKKRIFTKRNKRYIWTKQKFGIIGIAILTPFILSIPVGTFLAIRFYKKKTVTLIYLICSVVGWSVVLSCLLYIFKIKIL